MTEAEDRILEKLDEIGDEITANDLGDLNPKTTREYLMIMFPTQRAILKHMEEINEFGRIISERVGRLEATWKVGGAIILITLAGLAAKVIFGG